MRQQVRINLYTVALLLLGLIVVVYPARAEMPPLSGLIIKMKGDSTPSAMALGEVQPLSATSMRHLNAYAGMNLHYKRVMSGRNHVLELPQRMSVEQAQLLCDRLVANGVVELCEPDLVLQPFLTPNDTDYAAAKQWYLNEATGGINAEAAWDITTGSVSTPVVAVIDTGYRPHSEFPARVTTNGYDFITSDRTGNTVDGDASGRDSDPTDVGDYLSAGDLAGSYSGCATAPTNSSWHGTRVTSIIAASSNNNSGIAGINWAVKVLPVRVLGKCGGAYSDIIDAIRWSAGISVSGVPDNANPARVLNLSLGGTSTCSVSMQAAIDDARAKGAIIVAAAGNGVLVGSVRVGQDVSTTTPANCDGVLAVAATDRMGDLSSYSNFGTGISISAPGGSMTSIADPNGIHSATNSGTTTGVASPAGDTYSPADGTSFAAPVISGVASLILAVNPNLSEDQVRYILRVTARATTGSNCAAKGCGAGIVDARAALLRAQSFAGISEVVAIGHDKEGRISLWVLASLVLLLGWRIYLFRRQRW